jgi:hypothetical protein
MLRVNGTACSDPSNLLVNTSVGMWTMDRLLCLLIVTVSPFWFRLGNKGEIFL